MTHRLSMALAIAACFAIMIPKAGAQAKDAGIATVHMRDLVEKYWEYPLAQKKLNEERDKLLSQSRELRKDVMDLNRHLRDLEMEIKSPLLSIDAKTAKEKEFSDGKILLNEKSKRLREKEQGFKRQLMQSTQMVQKELMKKISAQIRIYAEKKGYKLVLDDSAPMTPVMYAGPTLDITTEVLKLLNAGHEEDAKKKDANVAAGKEPAPAKEQK